MNTEEIEKLILHPCLTKIGDDGEKPTYTTIKKLRDELISNAVAIPSDLGDGFNVHLFLVVSNEEYLKATKEDTPTVPSKPSEHQAASVRTNTRENPVDYNIVKEDFREYNASKAKYLQYNNVSRCLVKLLLAAVPNIYLQELSDPITKFGAVEPHQIIQNLHDNYGTISAQDLDANDQRMKTAWSPPEPIEILFNRLFDGKHFSEEAGDTMEDSVLTRIGYNTIFATGLFQQACYEWRKLTRVQQDWATFKIHFTAADKDRVNYKTLQDAGYHNANNATENTGTSDMAALTEAICLQTTTNQANFTKMLAVLEKNGNKSSVPRNGARDGRQLSYCWTHGRSDNTAHTGSTCNNKKDGHVDEATWKNKMGDSDNDYSKQE